MPRSTITKSFMGKEDYDPKDTAKAIREYAEGMDPNNPPMNTVGAMTSNEAIRPFMDLIKQSGVAKYIKPFKGQLEDAINLIQKYPKKYLDSLNNIAIGNNPKVLVDSYEYLGPKIQPFGKHNWMGGTYWPVSKRIDLTPFLEKFNTPPPEYGLPQTLGHELGHHTLREFTKELGKYESAIRNLPDNMHENLADILSGESLKGINKSPYPISDLNSTVARRIHPDSIARIDSLDGVKDFLEEMLGYYEVAKKYQSRGKS